MVSQLAPPPWFHLLEFDLMGPSVLVTAMTSTCTRPSINPSWKRKGEIRAMAALPGLTQRQQQSWGSNQVPWNQANHSYLASVQAEPSCLGPLGPCRVLANATSSGCSRSLSFPLCKMGLVLQMSWGLFGGQHVELYHDSDAPGSPNFRGCLPPQHSADLVQVPSVHFRSHPRSHHGRSFVHIFNKYFSTCLSLGWLWVKQADKNADS